MNKNQVKKSHIVCIPFPGQGHITPMLQLSKLLHSVGGFHITFVNTRHNHQRLLRSGGPHSMTGLPDFRFEAIPDGLPPSDRNAMQDVPALCDSTRKNLLAPFMELIARLNSSTSDVPQVSCIVSDGVMTFGMKAAEELGIPAVQFWTASACGFMGYLQYSELVKRGIVPFKAQNCLNSSAIIFNTFDDLENKVLQSLSSIFPNIYTIGPLPMLCRKLLPEGETKLKSLKSNLWKEDFEWLDKREPNQT